MSKLRLKWKVFIYLFGFCALLLVILWLFQTVFFYDMYKLIRRHEMNQVIENVGKQLENHNLDEWIISIQLEKDIMISPTQDFIPPQRIGYEMPARRVVSGFDTITETKVFTLKNGQILSLTFYALLAPVDATVETLRIQLFIVTGVVIVLAVFLAVLIAGRISKPIEEINKSAKTLATGDYNTRFGGKGFYEIVALSETLNTAASELGKVEGLRRELLANVSHDLRTPLALIYSYAEMMSDFPGEITPEQTKVIVDETRRLTSLVNDVLDVSKLESEMEQLRISRFNLTESVAETVRRVGTLLRGEGYAIDFQCDRDVFVDADETKIDRAFYNLLINAVNYSGEDRAITVSQVVDGGRVRVSVTDHGEGIDEKDLPLIWDRYYKSGKQHKRAVTGTGLGLSIARKIIDLHGGAYGVTSEVGKGSTFWFELNVN